MTERRIGHLLPAAIRKPALLRWRRLEPRPRGDDFTRSLAAEVHDPLWLLSRQWQLGELVGEDGGSPIQVQLVAETARLDGASPIAPTLTAECAGLDLEDRLRIGRRWAALLAARGLERYGDLYRAAYPFAASAGDTAAAAAFRAALIGRAIDGGALATGLGRGVALEDAEAGDRAVLAADRDAIAAAAAELSMWLARWYGTTLAPAEPPSWDAARLGYAARVSASIGGAARAFTCDVTRPLDWPSLESTGEPGPPGAPPTRLAVTCLPMPAEFPGSPRARFWEFEDHRVDLGAIDASATDLIPLLTAHFGLVAGHDWYVAPLGIPRGGLCRLIEVVVTDVFGERLVIRPATDEALFEIDGLSATMLVPDLTGEQEGRPIEEVAFVRDELANLAWAIELAVPDGAGGVMGRPVSAAPAPAPALAASAMRYRALTPAPPGWIPFVPVRAPTSPRGVRLARARVAGDAAAVPRGRILRPDEPRFLLEEEAIPIGGVTIVRTWHRARDAEGNTHVWLARRRRAGTRTLGSSGLAFDVVEP